ncbi:hypothetical protein SADUNF_Sadunf04G0074400 [Salix dunnii]|uniref:Uncharacterized protein n=1 Tax=Salix dunnii TaxID=1413687 RepID=A0A835N2S1_9ROSI|nr:hypothetical protein SADUNF_Sadunf04G0074400 [Salix dunnii]
MQGPSSAVAQPESILEWLQKDMGYRPLGQHRATASKSQLPSIDTMRKVCRGNMIFIWGFLESREVALQEREIEAKEVQRHKQVMLEAYDQQCDEAAKIFAEYHKRLHQYVDQARDAQRTSIDSSLEEGSSFSASSEKEAVYSTVKGTKSADDVILIETTHERNIRKACDLVQFIWLREYATLSLLMKEVTSFESSIRSSQVGH